MNIHGVSVKVSHNNEVASRMSLVVGLMGCLILSMIPLLILHFSSTQPPFMALVAGAYLLQLVLLAVAMWQHRVLPTRGWILLAVAYGVCQWSTLVAVVVTQGTFDSMDLVSAVAKVLGVAFLAGFPARIAISRPHVEALLRIFLWIAAIAVLYNIVVNAASFSQVLTVSSGYELSFRSFFANRNQFGSFLFISLIAHFLYLQGRKLNLRHALFLLLQVLSLVMTLSRGALVACVVLLGIMLLLHIQAKPLVVVIAFITILLGSWILIARGNGFGIIDDALRFEAGLSGRDTIWQIGYDTWRASNPFLGVGSFRGVELAQARSMTHSEFHSFFIETLVGGGLFELALVLCILVVAARRAMSHRNEYAKVFIAGFAGLLPLSVVESISFFTIGFVGTIYTLTFITLPMLLGPLEPIQAPAAGLSMSTMKRASRS